MCDKKTSSIVHAQQTPVEHLAELMTTAETELAAFYETVFRRYGLKEARKSAQDWIEELETMDWPADWALPNWRHVTIATADCLAFRIIDHPPSDEGQPTSSALGVDDGQCGNFKQPLGLLLRSAHVVRSDSWLMTNRQVAHRRPD
jgi:hypothetical protein